MLRSIKRNYFLLVSIFLIFYFAFNLVSGERGLFSFIEKKELLSNLKKEELSLVNKINDLDLKNTLLSSNLDLDYVETLIRERFLFGKEGETIYIIKNAELDVNTPLGFVDPISQDTDEEITVDVTITMFKANISLIE